MGTWADARSGRGSSKFKEGYHTAAVCSNGHPATESLELSPDLAGNFCRKCGAPVISSCPSCQSPIRGYYVVSGVLTTAPYIPPNFCVDCGRPFPWTTARLLAASELADELEGVSDDDKQKIKTSIGDIATDSPSTSLAAIRLKKWLGGAKDAVGQALWKIAIDVATQAAKKTLLGG